jgi:hypothetical protein
MPQVIDNPEEAGNELRVFVFVVYLSTKDHKTVMGYLAPFAGVGTQTAPWVQTGFGVKAAEAFQRVLQMAEDHGIPYVLVQDPNILFPPEKRPI